MKVKGMKCGVCGDENLMETCAPYDPLCPHCFLWSVRLTNFKILKNDSVEEELGNGLADAYYSVKQKLSKELT